VTRKALTTVFVALGLAVAPAALAMPMDNGRSATTTTAHASSGMSQEEYRALTLRGEALNRIYGNAATRLSAAQFKALYTAGGYRLSPQELAALVARGQGLNTQYGGELTYPYAHASSQPYHAVTTIRPDANGPDGIVKSTQVPSATVATVRPDENGPDGIVKSTQVPSATVATVRPDENGPDGIVKSTTQIPTASIGGGDGFQWNSVAIGAGTFAFVALLAVASFVLTRRRHHPSF
jgi:hypothetical protein